MLKYYKLGIKTINFLIIISNKISNAITFLAKIKSTHRNKIHYFNSNIINMSWIN